MKIYSVSLIFILIFINGCVKDDPHNSKILELGFSIEELYKKGVTAEQLFNAGASLEELIATGVPMAELDGIEEICLHDIIMAGGDIKELKDYLSDSPYTLDELIEEGLGAGFLKTLGFEEELKNRGYLGTLQDIEGNRYNWVKVGEQIWMSDNLRATKYSDGAVIKKEIPGQRNIEAEDSLSCYLDPCEDIPLISQEYCNSKPGLTYTYTAATRSYYVSPGSHVQGVCPEGWRLPTGKDINELLAYTQKYYPDSANTTGLRSPKFWHAGSEEGNDFFGLNIFPNMEYYFDVVTGFVPMPEGQPEGIAIYWTSEDNTFIDNSYSYYRSTYWLIHSTDKYISTIDKRNAICVRCIKDDN